jgi:hypothetical protein
MRLTSEGRTLARLIKDFSTPLLELQKMGLLK